jgi:fibro-slime domain-containing protein
MKKRYFGATAAGVAVALSLGYGCGGGGGGAVGGGDDLDEGVAGQGGAGAPGFAGFPSFGEAGRGAGGGVGGCVGDGCASAPVCGDGAIGPGEACDDGNAASGDGCSGDCKAIERDFACPAPGAACLSTVACGDRRISGAETCDDGNARAGDGCGAACTVEPGWVCPVVGVRCQAAACGDGIIAGNERCDDGDASPGDGCDAACQFEAGFACDEPGKPCRPTVCNDGVKEGTEACDDGDNDMGDGCTPACAVEPSCPPEGGACGSACGDGLHFAGDPEECEDGNARDGDGCSKDCKVEAGYRCTFAAGEAPASLELPLVLRDFKMGWNVGGDPQTAQPGGHPDFESNVLNKGLELGIVAGKLGPDGKPQYAKADGGTKTTTGRARYDQWYRDVDGVNLTFLQSMTLGRLPEGAYQFKRSGDTQFFPLNGLGFGNQGQPRNYHFTSEVRYWFEYKGGEQLDFSGDDDVWVFIDKRLVIDLGGVHGEKNGSVTLSGGDGQVTQAGVTDTKAVALGLEAGKVYEAVVWQAERHTTKSNYTLTLSGFVSSKSTCQSVCGDGVVTPDEACDDGPGNNTGGYGACNADCLGFGPRCGDQVVQADRGEACDDGVNLTPYGAGGCAPGCKRASFCGDGVVDSVFGEQCDDGVNGGGYGACAPSCALGPRCGDGVVQADAGEVCDDGNRVGGDGCESNCRPPVVK